jgi:hypothetical protein
MRRDESPMAYPMRSSFPSMRTDSSSKTAGSGSVRWSTEKSTFFSRSRSSSGRDA